MNKTIPITTRFAAGRPVDGTCRPFGSHPRSRRAGGRGPIQADGGKCHRVSRAWRSRSPRAGELSRSSPDGKRQVGAFDLSTFGHVQAEVTNTGAVPVAFNLRLDNDGDWKENPWNARNSRAEAGCDRYDQSVFRIFLRQVGLFTLKSDANQADHDLCGQIRERAILPHQLSGGRGQPE